MFFKNANHKGFTILELMIVVAILGLLTAIGLPGIIRARKRARARRRMMREGRRCIP